MSKRDWMKTTVDAIYDYMMSDEFMIYNNSKAFTKFSSIPPIVLKTSAKQRDPNQFHLLDDDRHWTHWYLHFVATAQAQNLQDILNADYVPSGPVHVAAYKANQDYLYSVFSEILLTDKGKSLIKARYLTGDAQTIFTRLCSHYTERTHSNVVKTTIHVDAHVQELDILSPTGDELLSYSDLYNLMVEEQSSDLITSCPPDLHPPESTSTHLPAMVTQCFPGSDLHSLPDAIKMENLSSAPVRTMTTTVDVECVVKKYNFPLFFSVETSCAHTTLSRHQGPVTTTLGQFALIALHFVISVICPLLAGMVMSQCPTTTSPSALPILASGNDNCTLVGVQDNVDNGTPTAFPNQVHYDDELRTLTTQDGPPYPLHHGRCHMFVHSTGIVLLNTIKQQFFFPLPPPEPPPYCPGCAQRHVSPLCGPNGEPEAVSEKSLASSWLQPCVQYLALALYCFAFMSRKWIIPLMILLMATKHDEPSCCNSAPNAPPQNCCVTNSCQLLHGYATLQALLSQVHPTDDVHWSQRCCTDVHESHLCPTDLYDGEPPSRLFMARQNDAVNFKNLQPFSLESGGKIKQPSMTTSSEHMDWQQSKYISSIDTHGQMITTNNDGYAFALHVCHRVAYFDMRHEWETLPHVIVTSDNNWDPVFLDGAFPLSGPDPLLDGSTYNNGTPFFPKIRYGEPDHSPLGGELTCEHGKLGSPHTPLGPGEGSIYPPPKVAVPPLPAPEPPPVIRYMHGMFKLHQSQLVSKLMECSHWQSGLLLSTTWLLFAYLQSRGILLAAYEVFWTTRKNGQGNWVTTMKKNLGQHASQKTQHSILSFYLVIHATIMSDLLGYIRLHNKTNTKMMTSNNMVTTAVFTTAHGRWHPTVRLSWFLDAGDTNGQSVIDERDGICPTDAVVHRDRGVTTFWQEWMLTYLLQYIPLVATFNEFEVHTFPGRMLMLTTHENGVHKHLFGTLWSAREYASWELDALWRTITSVERKLVLHGISRALWSFTRGTFAWEITHALLHGENVEWIGVVSMDLYNSLETDRVNLKLWAPRHVGLNSDIPKYRINWSLIRRETSDPESNSWLHENPVKDCM